jgi:hypothetical protein
MSPALTVTAATAYITVSSTAWAHCIATTTASAASAAALVRKGWQVTLLLIAVAAGTATLRQPAQ